MTELSETFKRLERDPQEGSQQVLNLLERFFEPFMQKLDEVLDKRLVRTLLQCLVAIMRLRNNPRHCGFPNWDRICKGTRDTPPVQQQGPSGWGNY